MYDKILRRFDLGREGCALTDGTSLVVFGRFSECWAILPPPNPSFALFKATLFII